MKLKTLGVFCLFISIAHHIPLKSAQVKPVEVRELNINDPQEVWEMCSIFNDPDIRSETIMDFDWCMNRFKRDPKRQKVFVAKTATEQPEVCGVLMCDYKADGQYKRISRYRDWKDGIMRENKQDDAVEFSTLGVHKDYRRQGVATKLMQAAQDECKAQGISYLSLFVYSTAKEAIKAYEKFGFVMPSKIYDDQLGLDLYKKINTMI